MLTATRHILEMIRFSHTLFALPFALLAMLMAYALPRTDAAYTIFSGPFVTRHHYAEIFGYEVRVPDWMASPIISPYSVVADVEFRTKPPFAIILLGVIACMVFARSAAMAFNRIADWKFDAQNPRTDKRHIPAKVLSLSSVVLFCVVCSALFILSTLIFLPNRLPLYLSVPVLVFLLAYSYTKRFTALAHFWLGAALMLTPICAWIAVRGEIVLQRPADLLPAMILGLGVMLWVAGFDIIYACQDAAFDKRAGLHSIPAKIGVPRALHLSALCHAGTVVAWAVLPWFFAPFGWIYWTGLAVVAMLLLYEHSLVRPNDLARVNQAFFNVNAIVSVGLLIVGALDLLT